MAAICVAFYGVRIELTEADIESCETRQHPLIVSSRMAGLQHYWSNFGLPGERFLLFVGFQLAIMSVENSLHAEYSDDEILAITRITKEQLKVIGFNNPAFHLEWMPDD